MGFPYGDGLYGKGLYSRRPDWWRDKACVQQVYESMTCTPLAWTPGAATAPPWAKGDQQAVVTKQAVQWGRTRHG